MGTWSYRVMRTDTHGEITYGIHEVYYDDAGNVQFWSSNQVAPSGETLEELRTDLLRQIGDAFNHSVLNNSEEA